MASVTGGAPAPLRRSHAKLDGNLGKLTLPDGRAVDDLSGGDLARALIAIGVAGASHANGREANAKLYAKHLEQIAEQGGKEAVAVFQRGVFQPNVFQTGKKR
jgi:hypothetical protein